MLSPVKSACNKVVILLHFRPLIAAKSLVLRSAIFDAARQ